MPPKKRDNRDSEASSAGLQHQNKQQQQQQQQLQQQPPPPQARMDQMHSPNNELFLQAFEKPTQIYRFLRTRNEISPVFLYRNLTYMRQRMSRNHKSRQGFRVNSILNKIIAKKEQVQEQNRGSGSHLTLAFLGFYDKQLEITQDRVKVETFLLKICHKKRKDVSSPIMQVSMGTSEVPINPSDNQPVRSPTISIPNESFSLNNGHVAKTYMLLLRVHCVSNNGCLMQNCDVEEPAQKRRKSANGTAIKTSGGEEVKLYGSELIVYDKHNRCLLADGEYELSLQEVQANNTRSSPKKHSSWETIPDIKDCGPFEVFSRGPMLKFKLSWLSEDSNGFVERPPSVNPLPSADNKENRPGNNGLDRCTSNHNNNTTTTNHNATLPTPSPLAPSKISVPNSDKTDASKGKQQIVYQFIYNNNSRQQTEACEDFHCPWCSVDCGRLYSLLKHLKLCHSRFTFTYAPIPQGARIDVAINECYDGSYSGSPHELISQPSNEDSRKGPTRRTSVTNIVVCRPKRTKPSLSEFLELDENEFENSRPYITGHNRLYHHTVTCLPIYPKELDVDSEGENDPKWLQTKTMMMIDDFTDVNEGEKELIKMWNLHVMKHGYVGDCQIPLACHMFLEMKGKELLMKNLYRNFVLHMCNLFDFGLISPVVLYQTIQKLQDLMKAEGEDGGIRKVLQKAHAAQVERWITNGSQNSADLTKIATVSQASKVNFNNELTNSNARRKTTLPMGSPPNSHHHGIKHPSMMATKANNSAKDNQTNGELPPTRRKSTNCIVIEDKTSNGASNSAPLRRKSMANGNDSGNADFPRRKLVLDAMPASANTNQKTTQNGTVC